MKSMCGCSSKCAHPGCGMFVLRIVTGIIFLYAGWNKFFGPSGIQGVRGFFGSIGLFPWLADIVAALEIIGGIALILGMWTCIVAPVLGIIMLGAIFWAKWSLGWVGIQFEVLILAGLIAIKNVGAGKWSLGRSCGCFICKGKDKNSGKNNDKVECKCDCKDNNVCNCDCHFEKKTEEK